jgi:hypothetical protein
MALRILAVIVPLGACVNLSPPYGSARDANGPKKDVASATADDFVPSVTDDDAQDEADERDLDDASLGHSDAALTGGTGGGPITGGAGGANGGAGGGAMTGAGGQATGAAGVTHLDGGTAGSGGTGAGGTSATGSRATGGTAGTTSTGSDSGPDAPPDVPMPADLADAPITPDILDGPSGIDSDDGSGLFVKLGGTRFGTGPPWYGNAAVTYDKAFDGDIATYVDDSNAAGFVGIDLGAGALAKVAKIRFYPRLKTSQRMVGGKFQCSADSHCADTILPDSGVAPSDGYVDLYTIAAEPPMAWSEVTITHPAACRCFRYLSPADSHTNIGELEFWAAATGSEGTPLADAGAPLTNLSFNKPVIASSQHLNGGDAVRGNDGLVSTLFCPLTASFPVWWMVDLGAVYPIVQTDINFENSQIPYTYMIEVSSDAIEWSVAVDRRSNTNGGGTITDAVDARARYVRLTITGTSTNIMACMWEFLVWGYNTPVADSTAGLTNLSIEKTATASDAATRKPASKGNDGLMATAFCPTSATMPVLWTVDLGANRDIARIDVSFEQQQSFYQYTIDVSADQSTWTTVVDRSTNTSFNGAILRHSVTTTARHVRLNILGVSSTDFGCFWELTVWGH